jgi:hypothetical protein
VLFVVLYVRYTYFSKHYRRKVTKTGAVWICSTFNTIGKGYCASKQIPESTLISITEETLGSINALNDKITAVFLPFVANGKSADDGCIVRTVLFENQFAFL